MRQLCVSPDKRPPHSTTTTTTAATRGPAKESDALPKSKHNSKRAQISNAVGGTQNAFFFLEKTESH